MWRLLVALMACAGFVRADGPNILFLFADDQRPDTIAAWGNEYIRTPNIDRLVERGFSFRRNYNLGGNSGAVCVPSRAMVNSGRAYFRIPHNLDGQKLLPELLGENGYVTFGTGKWHNGERSFVRGFQQGKAVMFGGMSNHEAVPLADVPDGENVTNRRTGEGFSSEMFADAAIEFLKRHDGSKPFYAYVALTSPHDPRQPPVKHREYYYKNRPPLPPNFMPQHPFHNGWMTGRDESLGAWPRTKEVVSDQLAEYYGMITHHDEQIGRVLAVLEQRGFAENTVVVYAADHGLSVGSHGLLGKQNVYEHSQGAPLIFAGPGIPKGRSSQAFTYLLDIYPTVCALTGVEAPSNLDGFDLADVWSGRNTDGPRAWMFTAFQDLMRSIRDDEWKLIRYPKIDHMQLFHLAEDPDELRNLAEDPEQAGRVARMLAEMRRWQEHFGDASPLYVDKPQSKEIDLSGRERKPDRWQPEWIIEKYF